MFSMAGFSAAIALLGLFFVLLVTTFVFSKRYVKVGPNEVLVISGRRRMVGDLVTGVKVQRNFRLLKGGGTFILPVLERVDALSLELMTIDVVTPKVYTALGVAVTVDGVAQVKIRGDDVSIFTAAEQFLSKSTAEIKNVALQTLEGHLRAILGTMTVEEVYRDRDAFAQRVQEVAAGDLANMGLTIISFTIRDIRDDEGYLDSLGKARVAEVKRDAAIGEANAQRDARIQAAKAMQSAREAELAAETRVAEADKDYKVQKALYDADVNRQSAEAELAYTLQQNITNQKVRAEAVQIEIVEKTKQIELQNQEIQRRERELEATVRKPAEARQFEVETLARARRFQLEAEAEGEAAAKRSVGLGEADANKARGLAQADVAQAQGLAEAKVIEAQGRSEAQAKRMKAEAWLMYNQAAIVEQLVGKLPEIAAAISAPLAQTERIVVIGGGEGGGAGASRVTADITNVMAQLPPVIEALTGIDLGQVLANLPAMSTTRTGAPASGSGAASEPEAVGDGATSRGADGSGTTRGKAAGSGTTGGGAAGSGVEQPESPD